MDLIRLRSLAEHGVSLDTETYPIVDGNKVPILVVGSVAVFNGEAIEAALVERGDLIDLFVRVLRDHDKVLCGANIAFDLAVLTLAALNAGIDIVHDVLQALADGRVFDLQLSQPLDAIAWGELGKDPATGAPLMNQETGRRGSYSLSTCVRLTLGREDAKENDEYRLRYGELFDIPIEEWPETAREYPVDDARNTHETCLAHVGALPHITTKHRWGPTGCEDCGTDRLGDVCVVTRPFRNLCDLRRQVFAAFALHLGSAWGFRVDQSRVDLCVTYYERKRAAGIKPFQDAGVIRADGSLNESVLKGMVAKAYGATRPCRVCSGTGKVLAPVPRTLVCKSCRGRSAPWKAGGGIKAPTVAECAACDTTGRVVDIRHRVVCNVDGQKTCDGTGLELPGGLPRSESGEVSLKADTLWESGNEFVMSYGDFTEDAKALTVYLPFLRRGRAPIAGHVDDCPSRIRPKQKSCTCPPPYRPIPLPTAPNVILQSGRVSDRSPVQTFPRKPGFLDRGMNEYIWSFRECIVARPGRVLSSQDFRAGELVTGAQSAKWLVGFSDVGRALLGKDSKGRPLDVIAQLGARVLNTDYEGFYDLYKAKDPRIVNLRQAMKPVIYGKPGGMGDPRMVSTQRIQGPDTPFENGPSMIETEEGDSVPGYRGLRFCILMGSTDPCGAEMRYDWNDKEITPMCARCLEVAAANSAVWKKTFREYPKYFRYVSECVERGQLLERRLLDRWPWLYDFYSADQRLAPGEIMQHVVGRVCGGLSFCDAANGFFQGLLADISKEAFCRVQWECYDARLRVPSMLYSNSLVSAYAGGPSPLVGSRAIGFLHDEFLSEHDEDLGHDSAIRISEIMRDTMRWFCPDYADAAEAEPTLMYAWSKGAAKVVHGGRVVPWTREHAPKTCTECLAA